MSRALGQGKVTLLFSQGLRPELGSLELGRCGYFLDYLEPGDLVLLVHIHKGITEPHFPGDGVRGER